MAWDDLSDMWWMQKPDRSNLPELAVGAFMQGMGQAQRRAEFSAELPMRIAESQARTAAQVAQTDIATKKFERENSEWKRIAEQEPVFADYSKKVANWISDPLNTGAVPEAPSDLTDEFRSKADKMMVDAALMKRQENLKGLAVQATLKDQEDKLDLVTNYGLGLQQAKDPIAIEMAKFRRAEAQAAQIESKYGITIPKDGIKIPMKPNGDVDTVAYEAIIRRMTPPPQAPAGMTATKITVKGADGRDVTYEGPAPEKSKETREEYIRKVSADAIAKGFPADTAATEAARVWDISTGSTPAAPLAPIEVDEDTIDAKWDSAPAGTQFKATKDIKLPDGGKIKAGTIVTKKSAESVKQGRADELVERRNELRSTIRTESKPGPFNEVVTLEQLGAEFFGGMGDRSRASTFSAPQGTSAVRTRQRTPEDAARLKKMQDELTAIEQELKTLQK